MESPTKVTRSGAGRSVGSGVGVGVGRGGGGVRRHAGGNYVRQVIGRIPVPPADYQRHRAQRRGERGEADDDGNLPVGVFHRMPP